MRILNRPATRFLYTPAGVQNLTKPRTYSTTTNNAINSLYQAKTLPELQKNFLKYSKEKHPVIKRFVDLGLDINAQDSEGETPLHHAISRWSVIKTKELLKYGANRDIKDNKGRTPLDIAKLTNNKEAIALLAPQPPKKGFWRSLFGW